MNLKITNLTQMNQMHILNQRPLKIFNHPNQLLVQQVYLLRKIFHYYMTLLFMNFKKRRQKRKMPNNFYIIHWPHITSNTSRQAIKLFFLPIYNIPYPLFTHLHYFRSKILRFLYIPLLRPNAEHFFTSIYKIPHPKY